MTKYIKVGDGYMGFPDDIADSEIESVLSKEFPVQKKVDTAKNSVMRDKPSAKQTSPVRPEYVDEVNRSFDNATPEQRKAMAKDSTSLMGRIAAERGTAYDRMDAGARESLTDKTINRLMNKPVNGIEMPKLVGTTNLADGRKEAPKAIAKDPGSRKARSTAEIANDFGLDLGIGVSNVAGAVSNLISPNESFAEATREFSKELRGLQSQPLRSALEGANARIEKAGQADGFDGVVNQFSQAVDEYSNDPALAVSLVAQNLPSLIPGLAVGKAAQLAQKVLPALKFLASKGIPLTLAAITNAVQNAGSARGEAYEDLLQTQLDQNIPKSVAEDQALSGSILPAVAGGITGLVSGGTGLEGTLLSKAAAAPIRKGLTELGSEQAEELLPKLATNYEAGKFDDRSMLQDVGRTMAETTIASAPTAAGTALIDSYSDTKRVFKQVSDFISGGREMTPEMIKAKAALEKLEAKKAAQAPVDTPVDTSVSQNSTVDPETGEIISQAQPGAVQVTFPSGDAFTGKAVESFEEDGQNFTKVVSDDGETYILADGEASIVPVTQSAQPGTPGEGSDGATQTAPDIEQRIAELEVASVTQGLDESQQAELEALSEQLQAIEEMQPGTPVEETDRVTQTAPNASIDQSIDESAAPQITNRDEYLKSVRDQLGDLKKGDTLENDMGDVFTVEDVWRNKQGEITDVGTKESNKLFNIDQVGAMLIPSPFTASDGSRQMSKPGKVNRAPITQPIAQESPVSDSVDLSQISDDDLATMVKNAQDPNVRKQIAAERRKRREKMLAEQASLGESSSEKPAALPKDLAGAKPRYAYGSKQFDVEFESDVDRAAYIAAQKNPSKRDADYLKFAMGATGMTEEQVRAHGQKVRDVIKGMAKDAEPGVLKVGKQSSLLQSDSEKPASLPQSGSDMTGQMVKFTRKGQVVEGKVLKQDADFVTVQAGDETLTIPQKRIVKDGPLTNEGTKPTAKTYMTKSGKVGAKVEPKVGKDGSVTFTYEGEWGAGSGLSPERMAEIESDWASGKKGFTVQDGLPKTDAQQVDSKTDDTQPAKWDTDPLEWNAKKLGESYTTPKLDLLYDEVVSKHSNPLVNGAPIDKKTGLATKNRLDEQGEKYKKILSEAKAIALKAEEALADTPEAKWWAGLDKDQRLAVTDSIAEDLAGYAGMSRWGRIPASARERIATAMPKSEQSKQDDMAVYEAEWTRTPTVEREAILKRAGLSLTLKNRAFKDIAGPGQKRIAAEMQGSAPVQVVGEFGPIFTEYKGDAQGAIARLMKEKTGDAVAALNHPDVGDIDLVWGTEEKDGQQGLGLAKIAQKHPEVLGDLQGFISGLKKDESKSGTNRIRLVDNKKQAVVSLDWKGSEKKWLLTAFDGGVLKSTTMDTELDNAKDDTARLDSTLDANVADKDQVDNKDQATPDFDGMFDDLMAEEFGAKKAEAPAPAPTPKEQEPAERTAGQAAASAAVNTAKGFDAAIDGLGKLFGGKPGQLNSGIGFDRETYEQAKPLFIEAARNFKDAAADIKEVMRAVMKALAEKFGTDAVENAKPYVVQFTKDVFSGEIDLSKGNNDGRSAVSAEEVPAGDSAKADGNATTGKSNSKPVDAGLAEKGGRTAQSGDLFAELREPGGERDRRDGADAVNDAPIEQGASRSSGAGPESTDFVITDEDQIGEGSLSKKYKDNIAAIKLLKAIEQEGRKATADERRVLAKYVGWGGLKNAFDSKNAKRFDELKALLTDDEFKSANESIVDAHYTSPDVVRGMWAAMERLGFNGGRVLEPSVGVGNFFGAMPSSMRGKVNLYGVDKDSLSAGFASQLYPTAQIKRQAFEDFDIPAEFFDLVIGNPPFGSSPIVDMDRSPYSGFSVHNYFMAKSIDKLRPGGLMAVVVTHNFMDLKDNKIRKWIAERADLVSAVRLPKTAFTSNANTEVVTDIVVFKKRSEKPEQMPKWVDVGVQKVMNKDGETFDKNVNPFFIENPQNVLGTPSAEGTMHKANEYTVLPNGDLSTQIQDWTKTLPTGQYEKIDRNERFSETDMAVPDGVKVESYFLSSTGQIRLRTPDVMGRKTSQPWVASNKRAEERMVGMIQLRDALRTQMRLERSIDSKDSDIEANRAKLNELYDKFQAKFGYLNSQTNRKVFIDDTEAQLVFALEFDYDKGISDAVSEREGIEPKAASAVKADIFKRRVQYPPQDFFKVSSPRDALLASLNFRGGVDQAYMEEVSGRPIADLLKDLDGVVFNDPLKGLVTADEYLSGDVKTKLDEAVSAAKDDPAMKKNVEALEKVIPVDKKPSEIHVSLGAPFIPEKYLEQFYKEISGGEAKITYIKATGQWLVDDKGRSDPTLDTSKYGTTELSARKLFDLILQGKGAIVKKVIRVGDKTETIVLQKETEAALAKQNAIKDLWMKWIWSDSDRADDVAKTYNDKMNRFVDRKYDGSHLSLPGMTPAMELLEHQKNGVWRGLQSRQLLLDHVVGAGKTFQMAALAMEMRRLGIARKPLFVVPNHLTLQWKSDFAKLYPGSNVLAATPEDFSAKNRQRLYSKIITGDWDAVIVGHSSIKKVGLPTETEKKVIEEQIDELTQAIEMMKRARGDSRIVSDMQKIKKNLEAKMKDKLASIGKRDGNLTFDELGVDALLVDEMHEFKNLTYNSTMDRVPGMGNPAGSSKAFDLFVKVRYLTDTYGASTPLITATGTPVSNSLVEMYNMQRYMQYETLKQDGLHIFDAWAKTYGSVESVYEVKPSGTGYRQNTILAKFKNMGSLMGSYKQFADIITLDDLKAQEVRQGKVFPVPKIEGGRPQNIVAERSPQVAEFMGVPAVQVIDGEPQFEVPDIGDVVYRPTKEGKVQAILEKDETADRMIDRDLGTFDSEADARMAVAIKAMTPVIQVDPNSILGKFDRIKQLTKETKGKVNALSLTGLANKAGLDYRMIDPSAPDFAGSKINLAVDRMMTIYKKWAKQKGTQIVFLDMSVPLSAKSAYGSKAQRLFVRDDMGEVQIKSGTLHAVEGQEQLPYYIVQKGTGDTKEFQVYDAVSGVLMKDLLKSRQDAKVWAAGELSNPDSLQSWIDKSERAGELEDDAIEEAIAAAELEEGTPMFTKADIVGMSGAGQFSAYDDMKAKLIARGVPENQIAFIHDYSSPVAKDKLFKAMKAGDIRFLFGSTPKLGAGTNVQDRLVGLHHIDAPWRPSDLEQREGRIIRRGNKLYEADPEGFEVFIGRYATSQTYDTRRWQILEHKSNVINQLRKFDGSTNEVDDIAGEAANASDMKAAASGDPLILEETRLKNDVKRLETLRYAHADEQLAAKRRAAFAKEQYTKWIPEKIEQVDLMRKQRDSVPLVEKEFTPVVVEGQSFKAKEPAIASLQKAAESVRAGFGIRTVQYRGVSFVMEKGLLEGSMDVKTSLGKVTGYGSTEPFSGEGFIQRMGNFLNRLDAEIDFLNESIQKETKVEADMLVQAKAPFALEADLEKAKADYANVRRALMAKGPAVPDSQKPMLEKAMAKVREQMERAGYGDVLKELSAGQSGAIPSNQRLYSITGNVRELTRISKLFNNGKLTAASVPKMVNLLMQNRKVTVKGNLSPGAKNTAAALQWLLQRNPNLDKNLVSILFDGTLESHIGGYYENGQIVLNANKNGEASGVHEVMHHAERMLPPDVQAEIRKLWLRDWNAEFQKGDKATKEFLLNMAAAALGDQEAYAKAVRAMTEGDRFKPADWYHLYSPSEYWAVNGADYMLDRATEGWVQKAVRWMREFVAFLQNKLGYNDDYYLVKAFKYVLDQADGDFKSPGLIKDSADTQFDGGRLLSIEGQQERFGKQVADVLSGKLPQSTIVGVVQSTPVLKALGFPDLPVATTGKRLVKIQMDHALSLKEIASLPGELTNPVMVYQSESEPDALVVVTKMWRNGAPIIAVVKPNQTLGRYEVNLLSSAYPKDHLAKLDDWKKKGLLRYFDKQKALDWATTGRVQFPWVVQLSRRLPNNIFGPDSIVNTRQNRVMSIQQKEASEEVAESAVKIIDRQQKLATDLNRFEAIAVHPRTIASFNKEFVPVYQAAVEQFEKRDQINAELTREMTGYTGLTAAQKEKVNKALEMGRLAGKNFRKAEDANLTPEEFEGYKAARRTMNVALDMFKAQFIREQGFDPNVIKTEQQILNLIDEAMPESLKAQIMRSAEVIREIEQAKRQGYVPFTRYGQVGVYVKDEEGNTIHFEKVEIDGFKDKMRRLVGKDKVIENIPAVRDLMNRLAKKYPDANRIGAFEVGKQSKEEVNLADLDRLANVAEIDTDVWSEVSEALKMAAKAKGFRKHFFGSANVPGYSKDFERGLADYIVGISGYLARRQYNTKFDDAIAAIPATMPNMKAYADKYREYINTPTEEWQRTRQAAFLYYIAGNLSTAIVNISQQFMTKAYLTQFSAKGQPRWQMARANKDALKMFNPTLELFDPSKAPDDVRDLVQRAWDSGLFVPLQTYENLGTAHNRSKVMRGMNEKVRKGIEIAALSFTAAERLNRIATFIATVRLAKTEGFQKKAKEVLKGNPLARAEVRGDDFAYKMAELVIDETHYRMGKVNRPTFMRNIGAPITQFKSFMFQTLELMVRTAALNGPEGKRATLYILAVFLMLGGAFGLPFAESLTLLAEAAYKKATKEEIDLKAEARLSLAKSVGPRAAELMTSGFGPLVGIDLQSKAGMGDIVPMTVSDVLGIPLALTFGRMGDASMYAQQERYEAMMGALLPNFAANMLQSYEWGEDGVRKKDTGQLVIKPEELSGGQLAGKAIGFTPSEVTAIRSAEYAISRENNKLKDKVASYHGRLGKVFADIQLAESIDESRELDKKAQEILAEVAEYNEGKELSDQLILNDNSIKQAVEREMLGRFANDKRIRKAARGKAGDLREAFTGQYAEETE